MQRQTVLDIGSVTKQFTAAGIMRLVDLKKLTVEDKVGQYFPELPADKAAITVHQLLTHRSGLPSDFAEDLDKLTPTAALHHIVMAKLVAKPGEKYAYSNTGYALLGLLIERLTGQTYFQFMRRSVFAPTKLNSTGFYGDDYKGDLYFTGYFNQTRTNYSQLDSSVYYGNTLANGGILSTVGDMYTWFQAITGTFLSSDSRNKLFTDYGDEYGYGWSVSQTRHGTFINHNGGGLGGNAFVGFYPDQQLTVIILSNRIEYRTLFGVPVSVSLPADEAAKQVLDNLLDGNFSRLPNRTLPPSQW